MMKFCLLAFTITVNIIESYGESKKILFSKYCKQGYILMNYLTSTHFVDSNE